MLNPNEPKKVVNNAKQYLHYTDIAFRMIATLSIGVFLGKKLDQSVIKAEAPWGVIILGLLALAAAMYQVVIRLGENKKKP